LQEVGICGGRKIRSDKIRPLDRDELDRILLKIRHMHDGERLESAAELALKTLGTLGDTTHNAVLARQQDDDPVGFGKVVAFEDEAFGLNKRHQSSLTESPSRWLPGDEIQDPRQHKTYQDKLKERLHAE